MASDSDFVARVCDQLRALDDISAKKMFGEYALYAGPKLVALIADNRLYVKPTQAGRELLGTPEEAPPYPGAKPSFLIGKELDDPGLMTELIIATERELPMPKPKKPKAAKKPR